MVRGNRFFFNVIWRSADSRQGADYNMGFVGKPSPYYYKRTTVEPEMFRNLNAVE
jgi:hypothetical protein